jgi:hypothetical protein
VSKISEHIFGPRRDNPKTCAYCGDRTINSCTGCKQHVCAKLECRHKHMKEFGLGQE